MPNAKKSVMIVDDEADVRDLFRLMLEDSYSIIEVTGGRECLEKLRTQKPDVILLDVMMPDMDGWQVLSAIKENKELKHMPVIVLSAAGSTKPFSKNALLNTIESVFHVKALLGETEEVIQTRYPYEFGL